MKKLLLLQKHKDKLKFVTFFSSNFIILITSFILLPFFVKYMSVTELGQFSLFLTFYRVFMNLIDFGSTSIFSSKYFKLNVDKQNKLVSSLLYFSVLIFGATILVIALLGRFFLFLFNIELYVLYLSLFVGFFDYIFQFFLKKMQLDQNAILYSILSVVKSMSISLLGIYLVAFCNLTENGRMFSWLLITFFLAIFLIILNKKRLVILSLSEICTNSKDGLNLLFSSLSGIIVSVSDVLFISAYISLDVTGIYSVGLKLGSLLAMFDGAFSVAWLGYFFKNKVLKYQRIYYIVILLVLVIQIIVSYIYFTYFLDSKFSQGFYISVLTGLGFLIAAISGIQKNHLIFYEKFRAIRNISIIQMISNILLNFALIPVYSMYGASIARILSFFIGFIALNYYLYKNNLTRRKLENE